MLSIVIIGTGNVAHHLLKTFQKIKDVNVVQVFGRKQSNLVAFDNDVATTTDFGSLKKADMYLIAVSDDVISMVSGHLKDTDALVVHTSGSANLNEIQAKRKGVFYPLQTLSKDTAINFKEVPLCLEASNSEDLGVLNSIAAQLSDSVYSINSEKRKSLHLAAVFVNNFTNHFYHIANTICEKENLSFDILNPLIKETIKKVSELSPKLAQTGPAKRNDVITMQNHLDMLSNSIHKKIYQLVSESIRLTHEEKL